jgi:hypothetical protein
MVAWAAFDEKAFRWVKGQPKTFNSSGTAIRSFCPDCGTGLIYTNVAYLPGIVDVQAATFDTPDALTPGAHIQTAERLSWMGTAHTLPEFERFPG